MTDTAIPVHICDCFIPRCLGCRLVAKPNVKYAEKITIKDVYGVAHDIPIDDSVKQFTEIASRLMNQAAISAINKKRAKLHGEPHPVHVGFTNSFAALKPDPKTGENSLTGIHPNKPRQ